MPARADDVAAGRELAVPKAYLVHHPIVVASAEGAFVVDEGGNRYIDFAGGIGVVNIGHRAPRVVDAIRAQTARFLHTGPVTLHRSYVELASRLADRVGSAPPRQTLFVNSGAEAVENAVKVARHATGRAAIIAFDRGFHGRTLLTSTLTGKALPYKTQPGSMAPDIHHAPYPYPLRARGRSGAEQIADSIRALDELLETRVAPHKVAAVILEPVQGEGGYIVPPNGFLAAIADWCQRREILLIVDEIQTGYGRTGTFFAFEREGINPDIVTVGKSIADGLPLAAVVAKRALWDRVYPGDIGGTYGGNPVACVAGLAVLDTFDAEPLLARANEIGDRLRRGLEDVTAHPRVAELRGLGAMLAIEFVEDRASLRADPAAAQFVIERSRAARLLLIKTGVHSNAVRFLPPLIADDATVDEAARIVSDIILHELAALPEGAAAPT